MSRINRRDFLAYSGALAAGGVVLGPGRSALATRPRPARRTSSAVTEINFWSNHPGGSLEVEQELINRFQAEYPDVTVNLIDGGANYEEIAQKFNAALAGGDLPDVLVLSDVWWFNYAMTGAIEPLDPLFGDAGVDPDDVVDSLLADYLFVDGQHYALPYARSTPLWYYNQEIWEQVGLEDRGPATWDEFDEWSEELQAAAGSGNFAHGWGNGTAYMGWTFQGANWTKGGSYSNEWDLNFLSDESLAAGDWLRGMINERGVGAVANDLVAEFSTGFYTSVIASTGNLAGITDQATFEWNVAPLPQGPNGELGCPTGGAGLAIPSGIADERKVAALTFVEFFTNGANTSYFSQNVGYMPVRKSAVDDPDQQAFLAENPKFQVAIDQLANTRSQDYARVFVPGGDIAIGAELERLVLENADVTEIYTALTEQLQTIIDRDIAPNIDLGGAPSTS